jgi:tetraacyldisaccharide 4'-kinase
LTNPFNPDNLPGRNYLLWVLLLPLSFIYGIVVFIRNKLFDAGLLPSELFPFPVISIGNITAGGTGKTPHVEYLVSILKDEFRVAVLSRGYKRKSSGFRIAGMYSKVSEVGDEPLQIKKKFPATEVAVSASRVKGIKRLLSHNDKIQVVILDDAFQHRWVKPGISMLLIDYHRPVYHDSLLPAGYLREPVSSIKRASIVVITKCPPKIKPIDIRIIRKDLNLYPWQSLYFTSFSYGDPLPVYPEGKPFPGKWLVPGNGLTILMVTGIATPSVFRNYLGNISGDIVQLSFPDHHNFTRRDIRRIERAWLSSGSKWKAIVTTEKDAVRLSELSGIGPELKKYMYYVPVRVSFIEKNSSKFNKQILDYVRKNKRHHIVS